MRHLSFWASKNVVTARWMIAGFYILANALGWWWATLLHATDVQPARAPFWITMAVSVMALLLHPRKWRTKSRYYTFTRHKVCDVVICLATVFAVAFSVPFTAGINGDNSGQPVPPAHAVARFRTNESGTAVTRTGRGVARFFTAVRHWYQQQDTATQVLLIVLTILLTLAAGFLWAAVCCGIACNGAETLAVILALAGWAGIIVGCVALCRRIIRGPRVRR